MVREFEIDAYRKGKELFVVLRGRLMLSNCQETKSRLDPLFTPQVDQTYLFMGELAFLDSAGLGVLVGLKMAANKSRIRFVLLSPPPQVEDIFRISKLDTIFEIRAGAEADILNSTLRRDEFCLWRDGKDVGRIHNPTEAHYESPPRPAVTNFSISSGVSDDNEHSGKIKQLCADAVEYIRQGDFNRAIEAYGRALHLDPDNLSALNNLAIVYEKRPEWYPQAVDTWKKVLAISNSRADERHALRARNHLDSLSRLT